MNTISKKEKRHEYYIKNKENILNYQKSRIERDKELRTKRIKANPEKVNAYASAYQRKNGKTIYKNRKTPSKIPEYQKISLDWCENLRNTWSVIDIEYLKTNYKDLEILEMAITLGRTYNSVARKLNLLKLYRNPRRKTVDNLNKQDTTLLN